MTHFFALMLWVASALALVAGLPQLAVVVVAIVVVVVVVNGVFAFVQEARAEHASERLRDLLPRRVTVVRDGRTQIIDASEMVTDDLVMLVAGDRVSADLRVVDAHALTVDMSLLTGESAPIPTTVADAVYAGTFVVEGEGSAVVEHTGGHPRLAAIAELTRAVQRPRSPLAHELDRVVRTIAIIAIGVGLAFFALALAIGSPASDGFLFAIGVTVALVPEGLLPTVTLSLAHGAQRMAARQALIRRLESVETLGSTTFTCTDKTGTLTRNEMTVVEVWTPRGASQIPGSGYDPTVPLAGRDPWRGRRPGHERHTGRSRGLRRLVLQRGDRAGLDHVRLTSLERPFRVLRGAVVLFDADAQSRQRDHLAGREHATFALVRPELDSGIAPVGAPNDLEALAAPAALEQRRPVLGQHVRIGLDLTADDDLAEAERSLDHDPRSVAGRGVRGEHHTRTFCVHHALHDHCDGGFGGHPPAGPVRADARREERGPALHDPAEELVLALHVRERAVHAREQRAGGVLHRRGGAHRHDGMGSERPVGGHHLGPQGGRDAHAVDERLELGGDRRERRSDIDVGSGEFGDALPYAGARQSR